MVDSILNAFKDELEKIARVPTAVKQYRRAQEALLRGDHLFHGTKPGHVEGILRSRKLLPASGTHGTGVYMWKGQPRSNYMRFPHSKKYPGGFPGIMAKKKNLRLGKEPVDPRPHGSAMHKGTFSERPFMAISEDAVALPAGTTIVADKKQLRKFRDLIREGRFRQTDSRILHRLEADRKMRQVDRMQSTDHYRAPTKKELVRLLRSKKPMPYVGMVRDTPRTKKGLDQLYGSYDEALGREALRDSKGRFDYF